MNIKAVIMAMVSSLTVGSLPVKATGSFEEHVHLYRTIQAQGVRIVINHKQECADGRDGSYHSRERLLVICQDMARPGQQEIDWTANDLDTLRHEAQHMVQDCAHGQMADRYLRPYYTDRQELIQFLNDSIGYDNAQELMTLDSYRNAPEHVKWTEMEAFAVAAVVDPKQIADALTKECR